VVLASPYEKPKQQRNQKYGKPPERIVESDIFDKKDYLIHAFELIIGRSPTGCYIPQKKFEKIAPNKQANKRNQQKMARGEIANPSWYR
jgi:hypothetical protein